MMNKKSYLLAIAAALLVTGGTVTPSHAAYDENLHTYTLDTVVVNADRTKNQFGDTITYRMDCLFGATETTVSHSDATSPRSFEPPVVEAVRPSGIDGDPLAPVTLLFGNTDDKCRHFPIILGNSWRHHFEWIA